METCRPFPIALVKSQKSARKNALILFKDIKMGSKVAQKSEFSAKNCAKIYIFIEISTECFLQSIL